MTGNVKRSRVFNARGELDYISPSSLGTWKKDRDEWVKRYMTVREREPQTDAMGIGSWFDWRVKSGLMKLMGLPWDEEAEFCGAVEEHNRNNSVVKGWGEKVWQHYVGCGAWASLVELVRLSDGGVLRAEKELRGPCSRDSRVVLMGKPDLRFEVSGVGVILDWKVNGLLSKSLVSPGKGYIDAFPDRGCHRGTLPMVCGDLGWVCGNAEWFGWADQTDTYAEILGYPGYYAMVDQVVLTRAGLRVCRSRVWRTSSDRERLVDNYVGMWEAVARDHVYTDLDLSESQGRVGTMAGPSVASRLIAGL